MGGAAEQGDAASTAPRRASGPGSTHGTQRTGQLHHLRALRAVPEFRRLLGTRLLGQCGDGLFQAALFSAVFFDPQRATSARQAAVGFATLLLPFSVVGPFAGVFLDRWRRQQVLLRGNLARGAMVVLFALLLGAFGPTSPPVVVLALVVVSVNRFVLSGLSASLPSVVDPHELVTANSFTTTLGGGAFALGGGLALALRPLVGTDATAAARTCLLAALVYVGAALVARTVPKDRLGPTAPPNQSSVRSALASVVRGLVEGAQHVRSHGPAFRALAAISAHRLFYGLSFIATLLLYTPRGALHRGGFLGLGAVVAASVVGGLLAALVTPRATRRLGTQRWITAVFAAAAVVEVAFGAPYTSASFVVAALGLGFAAQGAKICVDTLVQESVEPDFRGRVFSLYDTLFNVSFVAAAGIAALLVPRNGKSYLLLGVVAGGYALTALVYGGFARVRAPTEPPEPVLTGG